MSTEDSSDCHEIRVLIPHHLQTLASAGSEIRLMVHSPVTTRTVLDELERRFPMLRGTVREHVTKKHRPKVRFYANEQDITHQSPDIPLPDPVISGAKPFMIIGAISGG